MSIRNRLKDAYGNRYAVLATNFYNYETLIGVVMAAAGRKSPVILQLTKGSIDYLGLQVAVTMARSALKTYGVEGYLHLDHAGSVALVAQCLDAGFDSVMIDASEQEMRQNISITSEVVRMAEPYGAVVEAELGYVAKLGQSKEALGLTDPQEAAFFADQTGVDLLAVAIGNAHGFYTQAPRIDLERLAAIQSATAVPLVLHGSSGIDADTLRQTIARGICKVNLATEIKNAFMKCLQTDMAASAEIDLRTVFPPAIQAVATLVSEKLEVVGAQSSSALV